MLPEPPLDGAVQAGTFRVGSRPRTSRAYVPVGLSRHAPLLLVLHGSNQDGRHV